MAVVVLKTFCSWITAVDLILIKNVTIHALKCEDMVKSLNMQSVLQLTGLILSCDSDVTRLIAVDCAVRLVVKPRM